MYLVPFVKISGCNDSTQAGWLDRQASKNRNRSWAAEVNKATRVTTALSIPYIYPGYLWWITPTALNPGGLDPSVAP